MIQPFWDGSSLWWMYSQRTTAYTMLCMRVAYAPHGKNHTSTPQFMKYSVYVSYDCASVIPRQQCNVYVLPVLWMMSSFHIMGHTALGNIDIGTVLQQIVKNFQRICQGSATLTSSSYTMATPGYGKVWCLQLPCFTGNYLTFALFCVSQYTKDDGSKATLPSFLSVTTARSPEQFAVI